MPVSFNQLDLAQAATGIAGGEFTSVELVTACLERIHSREEQVNAWACLVPEQALAQAKVCDERPASTPMHGIPVGVKDIIDTVDMPTCYGSKIYENHYPRKDAECIRLLKQSGAVIMGKTVSTEFAFYAPGRTANPHNPRHTPGGSSSGSAAAVADFHVPVALGTQTSGSIIRPAAFNGIIGYKPTYNSYSLAGVHPLAPKLDTLGAFSRSPEDLCILHGVLSNQAVSPTKAARPGAIAFIRTPAWAEADEVMQNALCRFVEKLKEQGIDVIEPDESLLAGLMETQQTCLAQGAAESLGPVVDAHPDKVREQTRDLVEEGRAVAKTFDEKLGDALSRANRFMAEVFTQADLIITPSAPGEAPPGLANTGNPMFNRIWTFLQTPCLNIPLTKGSNGLPIGIQLVCAKQRDVKLFSCASYMQNLIGYNIEPPW